MKKILSFVLALLLALPLTVAAAQTPTVTVSIYSHLDEQYILNPCEIEWTDGMTAFSVLRELGVEFTHSSGYVTSIAGLAEKANGPYSGWIYTVDGERPQSSAARYKLTDGQRVEWIYTITAEQAGLTVSSDTVSQNASSEPESSEPTASNETSSIVQAAESEPASVAAQSTAESSEASSESAVRSSEPVADTASQTEVIPENTPIHTPDIAQTLTDAVDWLAQNPGDWTALALAMTGRKIPDDLLPKAGENEKITDTERRLIVGSAAGLYSMKEKSKLAEEIAAYDGFYNEGLNAVIFALIAYQAAGHADPADSGMDDLLSKQRADGGFALYDELESDIDVTAMALYALLSCDLDKTADATSRAQQYLLESMNFDGTFGEPANCESTAQALMALTLCEADTATLDQIAAALCGFATESGGFAHLAGDEPNAMSTEQAAMALYTYQNKTLPYFITTQTPERTSFPWVLILVGAIILVGGVGGFAVWKGRKGNQTAHE